MNKGDIVRGWNVKVMGSDRVRDREVRVFFVVGEEGEK